MLEKTDEIPIIEHTDVNYIDQNNSSHNFQKQNSNSRKHRQSNTKNLKPILVSDVISDIFLTLAILIALYIVYMLFWTGVIASFEQKKLVSQYQWDEPKVNTNPAPEYRTDIPCFANILPEKEMIGRIYVPKFGAEYVRNFVQGTNKYRVLDLQGYGHYDYSQMPGCIGNMAAAAHRGGFGESLKWIDRLNNDDAIVIRTQKYWYVYKVYQHEIVLPNRGDVTLPIPKVIGSFVMDDAETVAKYSQKLNMPYDPQNNKAAKERLLTFTTCHPRYGVTHRYIVHAKFDYWSKVKEGVPVEMLNVGTKIIS